MLRTSFFFVICVWLIPPASGQSVRSIDGSSNNLAQPGWGRADAPIRRVTKNGYADLMSAMGGVTRPNPRLVSNVLFNQAESVPNTRGLSDFWWSFGQFLDHDLTLMEDHPTERADIPVPIFDAFFDPAGTGTQVIPMRRTKYDPATGYTTDHPRTQINAITAWIDGSNIYGSSEERAQWLRTGIQGKLKVSEGDFLPYNTMTGRYGDPIDPDAPTMATGGAPLTKYFVAGDVRANEHAALTSLHTVFIREHNRLCHELASIYPTWTDEQLYQDARRRVIAMLQAIVFEEWLPALGVSLGPYAGYDPSRDPGIMNVFSVAAYRFGHSLINNDLKRLEADGSPFLHGDLKLRDAFFNPSILRDQGGMEPLFRGMAVQRQQALDTKVVHDLRNFLFGPPGAGGLDLAALNINRGRDCGVADYNAIRDSFGLSRRTTFQEITDDPIVQQSLVALYGHVDNIDPWVGMLAEVHLPDAAVGETIATVLKWQFTSLRDGDRFYYEQDPAFSADEIAALKQTRLAEVLQRNTDLTTLQADVFFARDPAFAADEPTPVPDGFVGIEVFPNPVDSYYMLRVEAAQAETLPLRVYDILGRVVEQRSVAVREGFNEVRVDIDRRLAAGVYLLALQTPTALRTVKFIKR